MSPYMYSTRHVTSVVLQKHAVCMLYWVSAMNSAETHTLLADWGKGKSSVRIYSQLRSGFFIFTAPHWGWKTLGRGFPPA